MRRGQAQGRAGPGHPQGCPLTGRSSRPWHISVLEADNIERTGNVF